MTTSAHEEQFREVFAQEATMLLARLSEGLLRLEGATSERDAAPDPELIASVFRDAHTLKGAAAVVGLHDVGQVAHAMEDLLDEVRGGRREVSAELVDALLTTVDGLSALVTAALSGSSDQDVVDGLVGALTAIANGPSPAPVDPPAADAEVTAPEGLERRAAVATRPAASPAADAAPEPRKAPVDTVSVPTDRLDDLVRLVGESAAAHLRIGRFLSERLGVEATSIAEYRDLSLVLNELQERTMRTRMVPVSTITDGLHRTVRDLARQLGKNVRWEVRGADTELDRGVLQALAQPLLHLVRNAVDHGIETAEERTATGKPAQATVVLHAMQLGSEVIITITDDGRGIDVGRVREHAQNLGEDTTGLTDHEALFLLFRSGFSTARITTSVSGRGVGLDVVRANVAGVRGRIDVRSELGRGSEFRIVVPITLAVLPCLIVGVDGERFAIPMHSVVLAESTPTATRAEGRTVIWVEDEPVALSSLAGTLGVGEGSLREGQQIVVLAGSTRRHAFAVDALLGQRDVVVKGLSRLLPRVDVLAGASVEPDGSILLVLDALGTIERARTARTPHRTHTTVETRLTEMRNRGRVLVVDDALTVRELQRSILERAGYQVATASDGLEAMARLAEESIDLVLTDVEMPRMDGVGLTQAIRAHPQHANLPVVMLTSLGRDEDRQRGLDAGADAYIVKASFNETALLAAIGRVLGNAA